MSWAGHIAQMGGRRVMHVGFLVRNLEGKRPICRLVDNIRMDLREKGLGMDWINLDQDRDQWRRAFVNTVMNLQVP
jgi:hypothetical protein